MGFVAIDPPGTWCNNQALRDILAGLPKRPRRFVDIGCGRGDLSRLLLDEGMDGTALDYSPEALSIARTTLAPYGGRIQLIEGKLGEAAVPTNHDCAISYMVMEHVPDDTGFVRDCAALVREGGHVIFAVPGRRDLWTLEDETVGHLRRYDRADLKAVMEAAGLRDVRVISVAVPVSNLLLKLGDAMIRRSGEMQKKSLDAEAQTKLSGVREIPWKTVFPRWVRLLLNPITMAPFFLLQRLFYNTDLGVTIIGTGRVAR